MICEDVHSTQGTQFSRLLSVPVQIWGKLGIVLYLPVLQHCLQRPQGFTNTFLGAIFGKRFNSNSFINNLLIQYICKELSKPKEKFWENLQRHLILHRNKNLQINQSSLIIFLAKDIPYLRCQTLQFYFNGFIAAT